jgi:hypothetical protein
MRGIVEVVHSDRTRPLRVSVWHRGYMEVSLVRAGDRTVTSAALGAP